jgi:hypothetical protein
VLKPDYCPEIPLATVLHPKHSKLISSSRKKREELKSIKEKVSDLRSAAPELPDTTEIAKLLSDAKTIQASLVQLAKLASKK